VDLTAQALAAVPAQAFTAQTVSRQRHLVAAHPLVPQQQAAQLSAPMLSARSFLMAGL
jgi:hypothetical protein